MSEVQDLLNYLDNKLNNNKKIFEKSTVDSYNKKEPRGKLFDLAIKNFMLDHNVSYSEASRKVAKCRPELLED